MCEHTTLDVRAVCRDSLCQLRSRARAREAQRDLRERYGYATTIATTATRIVPTAKLAGERIA